jgi:hypothetical protein
MSLNTATTELRYLEGELALKERMRVLSGRAPNATQASFAASCLLHGRLFWESAAHAPVETKPLLLYYGAASFAKLLVIAKTGCQVAAIASSHGASCSPGNGDTVGSYEVRTNGNGLFQQFNDVAASLCRLKFIDGHNSQIHSTPSALSPQLTGLRLTTQEILCRIPEIAQMYALCVGSPSSVLRFQLTAPIMPTDDYSIRIDRPEVFAGLQGLRDHVAMIRQVAPFLERWHFQSATHAWDQSIVVFCNRAGGSDANEFDVVAHFDDGQQFQWQMAPGVASFDALASLPPLAGGYSGTPSFIAPVNGQSIAEHSLHLLGLLCLSSLVRYRPHVWTSCVHRRRIGDNPVDDRLLPAIEAFLDTVTESFPRLVADVLLAR